MDVNSFLGALSAPVKASVTEGETPRVGSALHSDGPTQVAVVADTAEAETDSGLITGGRIVVGASPSATEEPSDATTDITPSGIEVLYQSKPKRLYRLRQLLVDQEFSGEGVEWQTVPSVTTVLDLLSKPALTWWGQKMGVQGVLDLLDLGVLSSAFDWDTDAERLMIADAYATEPLITAALTEHKLTVNHRKDSAADRGTNVHDALEQWGITGELPSPGDFPESESGYVAGLVGFLEDVRPISVRREVMVGSLVHGFAGRFDLVFDVPEECSFNSRCYPKRAPKREGLSPCTILGDLKTSKSTYVSHHLQLAAYELAAQECGYPATDKQAIIHVTAEGQYELVFSTAKAEHFLAIRKAHEALAAVAA